MAPGVKSVIVNEFSLSITVFVLFWKVFIITTPGPPIFALELC